MKAPEVPVSWGELIDKITILELKAGRLGAEKARANALRELGLLCGRAGDVLHRAEVAALKAELALVNAALWEIEDDIRERDAEGRFDARFIELARQVYRRNDQRAAIKRQINALLESDLVEEKSYSGGSRAQARQEG
jgi:hypothetical protein